MFDKTNLYTNVQFQTVWGGDNGTNLLREDRYNFSFSKILPKVARRCTCTMSQWTYLPWSTNRIVVLLWKRPKQ